MFPSSTLSDIPNQINRNPGAGSDSFVPVSSTLGKVEGPKVSKKRELIMFK